MAKTMIILLMTSLVPTILPDILIGPQRLDLTFRIVNR